MKTPILQFMAMLSLSFLLTGCGHEAKDRQAIIHVLKANQEARENSAVIHEVRGRTYRVCESAIYLHKLKQVDYSECPEEFGHAWLEYVQTWEQFANPSPTEKEQRQILARPTAIEGKIDAKGSMGGHLELGAVFGLGADFNSEVETEIKAQFRNNGKLVKFLNREDTGAAQRRLEDAAAKFHVDALKYED